MGIERTIPITRMPEPAFPPVPKASMKLTQTVLRWPLVMAFTFVATCATLAVAAPPDPSTLRQQLDALLATRVAPDVPGTALLVARGDTLLYRSARGLASVELAVPLAPEHAFRIGSITKQFAAATLLKLVDEGRARLDDPLSKYLHDFPNGSAITLTQLLNHSSGVKSYTGIPGYMGNPVRSDKTTAEMLAVFRDLPADFAPGADWSYNNSGYVLVGAVIEAITKRPWHEAVVARLQPLGITHTVFGDNGAVIAGMADGYSVGDGGKVARAGLISMTQPHAAGALVSTLDDLWRWNLALHRGQVLSADSYRRMSTPEGAPAQKAHYGFGLMTGTVRGQAGLLHGGGIHGYQTMLLWLPAQQLTVVVLRNSDGPGLDPGTLARQAAALALGDPYPDGPTVAPDAAALARWAGRWRRADGGGDEAVIRVAGPALTVQAGGGSPRPARPIDGGRFVSERNLSRIEFDPADSKRARFFPDGEGPGEAWQRVGDVPAERPSLALDPAQQQALLGSYSSPQFSFKVFLDAQGVLRGQAPGQPALQLHAQSPRQLYVKEVDANFEFEPAEGAAAALLLTQGRTKLRLVRQAP